MQAQTTTVAKILAKVQAQITGKLKKGSYSIPTSDTLLAVAKDLGFIEGRRGRAGGFEPTDEGLAFADYDVKEYRTKEAMETVAQVQERQEKARKAREERQAALTEELNAMTHGTHKEELKETNA